MAWTVPKTWTSSTTPTAAELNTYLRNNMLETAPAKATTPLSQFASTGANAIAQRNIKYDYIATAQTTSSTSFTNLSTVGPSVTVSTAGSCLVVWGAEVQIASNTDIARMSVECSGATSVAASDLRSILVGYSAAGTNYAQVSQAVLFSSLNTGTHTFTCKYRMTSGTGTFTYRRLAVFPQ